MAPHPQELHLIPLAGIGEVRAGDALADLIGDALDRQAIVPQAGDILVVTQKIVSKAEGRRVPLGEVAAGDQALALAAITGKDARLVQLVLDQSTAVVRAAKNLLIARHRAGHVLANAGIDRSNSGAPGGEHALLLPEDCDRSARRLGSALGERFGRAPAVVIADSFGRPWRLGTVGVALGASGLAALLDRRGERDRDGRPLEVAQVAIGDMLASAAGLVMGEGAEGIPAVLVRGLVLAALDVPAAALVRPLEEDLFR